MELYFFKKIDLKITLPGLIFIIAPIMSHVQSFFCGRRNLRITAILNSLFMIGLGMIPLANAHEISVFADGKYEVWGGNESRDNYYTLPTSHDSYEKLGSGSGNQTFSFDKDFETFCIGGEFFKLDAMSYDGLYVGEGILIVGAGNTTAENISGPPDGVFSEVGAPCSGCSDFMGVIVFQPGSNGPGPNPYGDCPEIEDLTFNISEVGSPSKPRPISDYGYEANPFEYKEDEYETYRKRLHNTEVKIAFSTYIEELDESTKLNFSQFVYNTWNYYWNVFQGFPFDTYTILFLNGPLLHNGAFSLGYEVEYPFLDCCSPSCGKYSSHAHEIFHAWPIVAKDCIREKWFIEGSTVYYEQRTFPLFNQNVRTLHEIEYDFDSGIRNWCT